MIGIVNGTDEFILDRMDTAGIGFRQALAEAQQRGYAEADPTDNVEGFDDAAAKAAFWQAWRSALGHRRGRVREGITGINFG